MKGDILHRRWSPNSLFLFWASIWLQDVCARIFYKSFCFM